MAKLEIVSIPDRILRSKSAPVERMDSDFQRFLDDLLETMYAAPGVGLAAIQVGVPRRVFAADVTFKESEEKDRNPLFFINPEIVTSSDDRSTYEEGCLSIPDYYAEVERPAKVRIRYLDREGNALETEAEGLLAVVVQHEFDHLNGTLFIDHISKLKRDMVIKKFTKAARKPEKPKAL